MITEPIKRETEYDLKQYLSSRAPEAIEALCKITEKQALGLLAYIEAHEFETKSGRDSVVLTIVLIDLSGFASDPGYVGRTARYQPI